MDWFILINLAFTVISWRWATQAFEYGHPVAGWVNIAASAMNGAAVLSKIF
jgi:hypothetical protein